MKLYNDSSNDSLSEPLHISLRKINRHLERIILFDRDLPSRSIIARNVLGLIRAGGKRLRPMMTIVGSRFGQHAESNEIYRLAAALELIHVASLIHDDILDQAPMRRGEPALHYKTDVYTAVHIGNYVMCRIIELMTAYSSEVEPYLHNLTSVTTAQLCLGEYQQMQHRFNFDVTLDQYWEKTRNKTAHLMASCLQLGASISKADTDVIQQLYTFGDCIGMAFQVHDDVLDFAQSAAKLGKPAGTDLRNGHITLPVMLAMEHQPIADKLRRLHANAPATAFDEAVALIRESDALDRALEMSNRFMDQAWGITEELHSFPASHDLQHIWTYFKNREQ
ncbi:polyprenyl synthetase family protein [Paenibacillus sp. 481]|uniref:polyprenyl synthetase family protein n=1 Tax=Paenibacillus sp. 481 TaxID=2835869 RepID=UPI001E41D4A6|nr:polyprenyl synthetase family protein [Paenibacillus sp. 481]UHA75567.1 polyprenyl synthetase family protein [Paenibacillus sp. 481]